MKLSLTEVECESLAATVKKKKKKHIETAQKM